MSKLQGFKLLITRTCTCTVHEISEKLDYFKIKYISALFSNCQAHKNKNTEGENGCKMSTYLISARLFT